MLGTKGQFLAVVRPEFKKIEAELVGGMARIANRIDVIEVALVMRYTIEEGLVLLPGDKVLLRGDSGLQSWAKAEFRLEDGTSFVLCPESSVIGYRVNDK